MKKIIGCLLIIWLYIAGVATPTYADDASDSAGSTAGLGFSYKVKQPENQRNKEVGYFDLTMTSGQTQEVEIELLNNTEVAIEAEIRLNGAKTNGNGVIEYASDMIDNDKSLKYDFVDIVSAPETVKIPANGSVPVTLAIKMPEVEFDGFIAGGIELKRKVDEKERAQQTGVINEYAFMIGMLLSETDTVVTPDLELNKVYAGLNNYRNSIFVNFSNVEANFLEDLTTSVQIMKKGEQTVLYETKKANMRMAPNSLIDFPVSMNGEKMVAGDYTAVISATSGDRKWNWTEDFTITDEEADKFNKQDVELLIEQGINWKLVAIIVAGVFVVIMIIFLVIRTINKKKTAKKKAQKKAIQRKKKDKRE